MPVDWPERKRRLPQTMLHSSEFVDAEEEALGGRLLVRPPRKLNGPLEGASGYIMRLADENKVSFADALKLELALGTPAAWEVFKSQLDAGRPRLTSVARWCPHCLRGCGYWLDAWEVPLADACPECGHWLIDSCSGCGDRLNWKRRGLMFCDCGTSLSSARTSAAASPAVALSRALVARAQGRDDHAFRMLDGLCLGECLQLCQFLACIASRTAYRKLRSVSELQHLEWSWNTNTLAAAVLVDWPNAMIHCLRSWNAHAPEERRGSLVKVFGRAYVALHRDLEGPKFEFLRVAFGTYVAEYWTGAIAKRNRAVLSELSESMAWVPIAVAARRLRLTAKQVRTMANKGLIPSESRVSEKGRRFIVISSQYLRDNAKLLTPGYTLQHASRVLGLPESRMRYLVPMLCPEAQSPVSGGTWAIPAQWVHRLKELAAQAPVAPKTPGSRLCTVQTALRTKLTRNAAAASMIKAIFDGGGLGYWRKPGRTLFGKLLLDWDDLCQLERSATSAGPTAVSMPNAAKNLGVKEEVVYALSRLGLLQTRLDRGRQRPTQYTTPPWIEAFRREYVFGRDLAAQFNRSPRFMATWLERNSVPAIAGPGVGGCRQLVYRREDITKLVGEGALAPQHSSTTCDEEAV